MACACEFVCVVGVHACGVMRDNLCAIKNNNHTHHFFSLAGGLAGPHSSRWHGAAHPRQRSLNEEQHDFKGNTTPYDQHLRVMQP